MTKLTDKQQAFVDEYLIDLNATQAAIRAKYSKKTAQRMGSENLSKPLIAEAIAEAKAERSRKTKIDAAWVLTRLAEEANADLGDVLTQQGQIKPVDEWPMQFRRGLVSGIDVTTIRSEEDSIATVTKIKLSDRVKRLELIGRHVDVQAFKDKVEVDPSKNLMDFFDQLKSTKGPPSDR